MTGEGFRKRNGNFAKSSGIMGGHKCPFCRRKVAMGAVDDHRCQVTIISISIGRAQLKRIDQMATAARMSRSAYLAKAALATNLTADELRLLDVVRGMQEQR